MTNEGPLVLAAEVQKHATQEDCWIVVEGKVWDLTDFAPEHPGGLESITEHAGHDATEVYNAFHAPSLLPTTLGPRKLIGKLDPSTPLPTYQKPPPTSTPQLSTQPVEKPPLDTILSTHDFEAVASRTLTPKTWAFYSSAATDCHTLALNNSLFHRLLFRPRLLRNVRRVNTHTTLLGHPVSLPFFVSPAAMARMAHPEGEKALARGCASRGVMQCVSTNASFPIGEIVGAVREGDEEEEEGRREGRRRPVFFFQLYVNRERAKSEALLREVEALGVRAVVLTVDAPVAGKREADERVRAEGGLRAPMSGGEAGNDKKGGGMGRIMGSFVDPTVRWEDIGWIRRCTKLPLVLKGIQCAADAKMAMEMGVDGIIIVSHSVLRLVLSHVPRTMSTVADPVFAGLQAADEAITDSKKLRYVDIGINLGDPVFRGIYHGKRGHHDDFEHVLQRALEAGCRKLMVTGSDLKESEHAVDIAKAHPGLCYATIGVHPCSASQLASHPSGGPSAYLSSLRQLAESSRTAGHAVAFGEIGLDYDRLSLCPKETQLQVFDQQLDLAAELDLPLFLHMRAAMGDFERVMRKGESEGGGGGGGGEGKAGRWAKLQRRRGLVHSFTGTLEEMRRVVAMGFDVGVNGCSMKTEENVAVVREVPLERLQIETDGPWCEMRPSHASAPFLKDAPPLPKAVKKEKWTKEWMVKGRNEPCAITQVAWAVAKIKGIGVEEVCEAYVRILFPSLK
ncbi:MAG: hypothetical protein Q9165_002141 [Trypethelium subeluteriae]